MNTVLQLDRLLDPDPGDPGCDLVRAALPLEAETELDRRVPQSPDPARHLRDCGPCAADFTGLMGALRTCCESAQAPRIPHTAGADPPLPHQPDDRRT